MSKKGTKKTNGDATKVRVSAEEFVTKWQKADTSADALEALGPFASARAAWLRKRGVNLKKFHGGPRGIDADVLNKLI